MYQMLWKKWEQWITQTCFQSHKDFLTWELQAELRHDNPLFCSSPEKLTEGEKKSPFQNYLHHFFP